MEKFCTSSFSKKNLILNIIPILLKHIRKSSIFINFKIPFASCFRSNNFTPLFQTKTIEIKLFWLTIFYTRWNPISVWYTMKIDKASKHFHYSKRTHTIKHICIHTHTTQKRAHTIRNSIFSHGFLMNNLTYCIRDSFRSDITVEVLLTYRRRRMRIVHFVLNLSTHKGLTSW